MACAISVLEHAWSGDQMSTVIIDIIHYFVSLSCFSVC